MHLFTLTHSNRQLSLAGIDVLLNSHHRFKNYLTLLLFFYHILKPMSNIAIIIQQSSFLKFFPFEGKKLIVIDFPLT